MQIVNAYYDAVWNAVGESPFIVTDVRIGPFYTAVALSNQHVGVAFTPRDLSHTACCPKSAAEAPEAGALAGQPARQLAQLALSTGRLKRAVGIATLNALATWLVDVHGTPGGTLHVGRDALEAASIQTDDRVVLVGAFTPFIKTLKDRVTRLWIVDKNRSALKPDEQSWWCSPEQVADILPQADVAIITGSTLVEGGLDNILPLVSEARCVVLAGPTAPLWTRPFFARGVHILAGIRIHHQDRMMQTVSEGGAGRSFERAADKVCVIRNGSSATDGRPCLATSCKEIDHDSSL